jgi:twitching motility protein PilT
MKSEHEIPTTAPAGTPVVTPVPAGDVPQQHAAPAPQPPGPASFDFSQLPPPAVVPVDDVQPVPAPPSVEQLPGFVPAPAPGAIPGFIPAPIVPVIPMPDFQELPPMPLPPDPATSKPQFVADEWTAAARARADADLLTSMEAVVFEGASDLHVTVGSPPMIRVDGALKPVAGQEVWDRERVAAALYSLLTDEQRARFDEALELDFAFTLSENARFRVNFYLQRGAIGGAFRLIPTEIRPLSALGVPDVVSEFAKLPRGLVLVTGPTGSGKSTTLAALIDLVNSTRSDHIVTVEDPIEFMHRNKRSLVNQREVGADTLSFANALKHVLRQDPDVILIGELRDLETISVALTAAETGHLVFATLHTQDAGQTIDRVIDVFPPHQQGQVRSQLAATLQGVVCQTLVRKASGIGRAVATEVLVTTSAISNLIREGKTYQIRSSMQAGRAQGMHTMDQHLADLVNSGAVAYGAALEKVHDQEDFKRLVHRTGDHDTANAAFASDFGARR